MLAKINNAVRAGIFQPSPGAIAAYIQDFETQKADIDYEDDDEEDLNVTLILRKGRGRKNRAFAIDLEPAEIKSAFHCAFDAGINMINETSRFVLGLGKEFGVLCCGGSSSNRGFRSKIGKDIESLRTEIRRTRPDANIGLEFLGEKEFMHWLVPKVSQNRAALTSLFPGPQPCLRDLHYLHCNCPSLLNF